MGNLDPMSGLFEGGTPGEWSLSTWFRSGRKQALGFYRSQSIPDQSHPPKGPVPMGRKVAGSGVEARGVGVEFVPLAEV